MVIRSRRPTTRRTAIRIRGRLSGSNDGTNWTVVDTRNAQDFATRFETRLYEFSNDTAYEYYKFDFQTEFGVTGQNQPNSIQIAEIELLSTGPVDFAPLVDLDVEAAWTAAKTSVYQRIEFDVTDPSAFNSLMLEMQYEDGFVAYLNGKPVASRSAPALPNFQSHATGERDDADALDGESINLTQHFWANWSPAPMCWRFMCSTSMTTARICCPTRGWLPRSSSTTR